MNNEPLLDERMKTSEAEPRREPFPVEGWLWLIWHRVRGHDVHDWGWSISRSGSRRNWLCLGCHRTWR
jgi:hypothetical protein